MKKLQVDQLVNPERCQVCRNSAEWWVTYGTRQDYTSDYYCDDCLPGYARRATKGEYEALYEDVYNTIRDAEGDWWLDGNTLIVETVVSRDLSRSRNGGEYSFYREFISDGVGGVLAAGSWSAEFDYDQYHDDKEQYDCIVSPDGLERMAKMADLTIAARAWLAKEKGCMAKLKRAVRSLGEE